METVKAFLERWDILGFVIAGVISLFVGLLYKGIKNLVIMKRKPFNISRQTTSRTVYDNRQDGDFTISVSYKGQVYAEPLTMLRIRLLNDGENDINYIRQCARPISVDILDPELIDVFVEPSSEEIEAHVTEVGKNAYDLSWSLLKKDEFIDLVIVGKGKDLNSEQIRMKVRADGIDKIKSPEYRVWPQLWPMLLAICISALVTWFVMPAEVTFIPLIPQNVFWTGLFLLLIPFYIILVLVKRIKWQRE